MIDTHVHWDLFPLPDRELLAKTAHQAGVIGGLVPGLWGLPGVCDSGEIWTLPGFGVHPWELASRWVKDGCPTSDTWWAVRERELRSALNTCSTPFCFLGETGFDLAEKLLEMIPNEKRKQLEDLQWLAFEFCASVAAKRKIPLVLHSVRDVPSTLKGIDFAFSLGVPSVSIHAFGDGPEVAKELIKKNVFLGFGGVPTWSRSKRSRSSFLICPLDLVLIETDGPELRFERRDGTRPDRTEPAHLFEIAELLAELKGVSRSQLMERSDENLFRFLGGSFLASGTSVRQSSS